MNTEALKNHLNKLFLGEILSLVSLAMIIGNTASIPYLAFLALAAVASLVIEILEYKKFYKENNNFKNAFLLSIWNKACLILAGIGCAVSGLGGHFLFGMFLLVYSLTFIFVCESLIKGLKEIMGLDDEVKYNKYLFLVIKLASIITAIFAFLSPFDFVTQTPALLISFGIFETLAAVTSPIILIIVLKKATKDIYKVDLQVKDKQDDKK